MTDEKSQTITVRVPASVVQALRALARRESERTGWRIDLSSIVRRALAREVGRK